MNTSDDLAIFDIALDMLSSQRLDALTLRALANESGKSPSNLVYRFGSRDGFVDALRLHVGDLKDRFWQEQQARLLSRITGPEDLSGLALGLIMEKAVTHRPLSNAIWEFELAAAVAPVGSVQPERFAAAEEDFWNACFAVAGLNRALAPAFTAVVRSYGRLLLIPPLSAEKIAWVSDGVGRLVERLAGMACARPGDSVWRDAAETLLEAHGPRYETYEGTPGKIVRAASEIILEEGCSALSHRSIAKRAGVSLSSMTHHFKTLEDILIAAFWSIYDTARAQAVDVPRLKRSYGKAAFIHEVLPELSGRNQQNRVASTAMEEVILSAARRPELQDVSTALFALMGATSHGLISAINDTDKDLDRLDAQIFRLAVTGLQGTESGDAGAGPSPDVAAFLEAFL